MVDDVKANSELSEEGAKAIKAALSEYERDTFKLITAIKSHLPSDSFRVISRNALKNQANTYMFAYDVVATEIGDDAAEKAFKGSSSED